MGSASSKTTTKISKALRPSAIRARQMVDEEFPAALEAAKELDLSDPELSGAVRGAYLRTVRGDYLADPYLEEAAGRAADVAQRGVAGMLRNYGSGAYANAVLDARREGYLAVRERERARQHGALALGPEMYELATAPLRDRYRARVADPLAISRGYGAALADNPLMRESRSKTKTPFDWGGFFANLATDAIVPTP